MSESNKLRHVGIIMDGNNRWAKREGKQGISGHRAGVERIRDVLAACRRGGVEALTVFAFSSENWRRPSKEVEALMGLFYSYLRREARKLAEENVRLKVIGRRDRFSPSLLRAIDKAENVASSGEATLIIAADYGGKWDITQAACNAAKTLLAAGAELDQLDEQQIDNNISTAEFPPLDMLIRTGGELRISNFLLWQAAYAELYFSPLLWPEFDAQAMDVAIADFYSRQRRFGYTGDQIESGVLEGSTHA